MQLFILLEDQDKGEIDERHETSSDNSFAVNEKKVER